MAEDDSGERTEAPSGKRRDDFRKKGQVAQSKEVQNASLFTIVLLFWIFYLPTFWKGVLNLVHQLWQSSGSIQLTAASIISLAGYILQKIGLLLAPLFLLVVLIGFFSTFFQIGWLVTTQPLIPDFSKLDPISGMTRFFSRRSLIEVVKSLIKISLIAWIAFSTVFDHFAEALLLVDNSVPMTISYLGKVATIVMMKICAILTFIAFLDFLFIKWEMEQKMKMTKQELKEEFKETEGDPHVKAQIRSIQHEMARKRMMADVPKADVVVTNPTHIAVALKYELKKMDAPVVLAKGSDYVALKIREIAREHDIPIVENPPVARLLHKLRIGEHIPEDLFKAVAEILAYVYSLKGKKI